ncbi:unnamed protein product [Caenorhabditis auriculariae]|uniref:Uncharacterized protein n=1 Tax=Caenorhabditis auriculariae TaxID=2777116 RepID=A0A8S1HG49_9PELO|nr:unnamed protein product [Caenorhabditis auriculariae]
MLGEMSELKTYVIIALSAVLFLLAMCILDAFSQKTSLVDSGITSRSELTRADRLFDPLSGLRSVNDVDLKKERELVLRSQFEKNSKSLIRKSTHS